MVTRPFRLCVNINFKQMKRLDNRFSNVTGKPFLLLVLFLFSALLATYWNHFHNGFHFDDFHTITQNPYVTDLSNVPRFFTDFTETQSTRTEVKTFRPLVTTMNAFSYWLGNDYNPFYFHLTIFIFFLFQLVFMFFLFRKIFSLVSDHMPTTLISLFAVALYGFHTANAETVNYIIARSSGMSAFFVVLALMIYACFPRHRRYGFFLIPAILGLFTKEQAAMFAPILLFYVLLFEQRLSIADLFRRSQVHSLLAVLRKTLPTILLVGIFTYVTVFAFRVSREPFYGHTAFEYAITQPFIWLHYFISFIYPYKLSADPDMGAFRDFLDPRMWAGFIFLVLYVFTIIRTSSTPRYRPISFGLIWFGVSLLPTSSIFPLGQITNDHRMYFPFVGLSLSTSWALGLLVIHLEKKFKGRVRRHFHYGLLAFVVLLLSSHALGTHHRNKVWSSEESLWYDAVQKSPNNARALMNYGLTQMAKGHYEETREVFLKAYRLSPNYNYLLVNMGILYNAMDKKDSARFFFERALQQSPGLHVTHHYYGRYLFHEGQPREALQSVKRALEIVPHYMPARRLKMNILFHLEDWERLESFARETLSLNRNEDLALYYLNARESQQKEIENLERQAMESPSEDIFITLSLRYYKAQAYEKSIHACERALEINPRSFIAYNNMGSAHIAMGEYEAAIAPLEKALEVNPEFQRARNNLRLAESKLERLSVFDEDRNISYTEWITLSLEFYRSQDYKNSIRCCKRALEINPRSANAYNNICAAYNKLEEWEKAAEACEKALEINPEMQRARNNLLVSQQHLP